MVIAVGIKSDSQRNSAKGQVPVTFGRQAHVDILKLHSPSNYLLILPNPASHQGANTIVHPRLPGYTVENEHLRQCKYELSIVVAAMTVETK